MGEQKVDLDQAVSTGHVAQLLRDVNGVILTCRLR